MRRHSCHGFRTANTVKICNLYNTSYNDDNKPLGLYNHHIERKSRPRMDCNHNHGPNCIEAVKIRKRRDLPANRPKTMAKYYNSEISDAYSMMNYSDADYWNDIVNYH